MRFSRYVLLCVVLCLLILAFCEGKKYKKRKSRKNGNNKGNNKGNSKGNDKSNKNEFKNDKPVEEEEHRCSLTRGSKLTSFVKGTAHVQLPCRYMLTEFTCNTKTEVIAESSFGSDGRTYVSGVSVKVSRDTEDKKGKAETDTASITMAQLKKFLDEGDTDKPHWKTSGKALVDVSSDGKTWRLQDSYNSREGQTVLRDGSKKLRVYLSYVDSETDKSKDGNLTVVCTAPGFKALPESTGYLCGNVGDEDTETEADSRKHIKEAAAELRMTTSQYLTYNVLVQQDVEQTNPLCTEAARLTKACAVPEEAVKICNDLLDSKLYARCFKKHDMDPLQAYVDCVSWNCRRDVRACRNLLGAFRDCRGGGPVKRSLDCGGGY